MTRKGFCFIEVLGVLAILSILLLVNLKGAEYYEKHISRVESITFLNEVKGFLSTGKRYCFENEVPGEIYFDNCEKLSDIYFIVKGRIIKKMAAKDNLYLKKSNILINNKRSIILKINKYGYIDPYTIEVADKDGTTNKIVIQVGGNLIYIKDE